MAVQEKEEANDVKNDKNKTKNGLSRDRPTNKSVQQTFQEDDDEDIIVEKTSFDKFINYIFCRGDLAEQKLSARPVSLKELFRFSSKFDILLLLAGCLGAILSGFCQPVLALLSGAVFNLLLTLPHTSTEFRDQAFVYVYLYFGVGAFILIVNFVQFMSFQHVCCRLIAQMRHRYLCAILRQNSGWFDKNQCGVLTTQLNDNIERVREGIGDKLGLLIRGFAMFFSSLVVAFIYDWRIALFMSPLAILTCGCMSIMSRKMADATNKELKEVGKAGGIAEEAVLGVRTVQAFNGQEEMVERYVKELSGGKKHALNKSIWGGTMGGVFYVILFVFMGSGLLLGGYFLRIGLITDPGIVLTSVLSMMIGAYFLGLISPHLMVLLNARVAAAVIYKTIDRIPKIDVYSVEGKIPMDIMGSIEFKNVHFRYPTRRNQKVLNGLNLSINAGDTVAFVGHSGCGKSTCIGLLTRLYEVESGSVCLDGFDVRDLNIDWLRNTIGIVQQEPTLFNETIEENLKIGNPQLSQPDMISICKMANAHEFIMKLPKGYKTQIGDGGVQLSGGQKQRIAIARTLARNPRILLLDEATSALDAQSESIVQEALDNASAGRTTIIIAHRLSTVRNASKIVVFEKGNILEQGTHAELDEKGGRYSELVKAQQFQAEEGEDDEEYEDADEPGCSYSRQTSSQSRELLTGEEEFIRGSQANDSFNRRSIHMGSVDMAINHDGDAYEQRIKQQMEEDDQINCGIFSIYRRSEGCYTAIFLAFLCALIRGFEMPLISVIFGMVYQAFDWYKIDTWRMQHELVICLIAFTGGGIGTFIFHSLSSGLFGYVSETVSLKFRRDTFRNILHQDAGYFDNPQHAPGRLITRLASDAPNVKAVIDGRMMYVAFNMWAWFVLIIISIYSSWAVGVLGLIMSSILGLVMTSLARLIQKRNLALMKNNPAGKFSIEIIENVRTIQLLTREKYFFEKYQTASKYQKRMEMSKGLFEGFNFAISQTFIYFAMGASYALGITLIYNDYTPSDTVYRGILSTMLSCIAIMNCSSFFPEFVKAKTSAGILFQMIDRKPITGDHTHGAKVVRKLLRTGAEAELLRLPITGLCANIAQPTILSINVNQRLRGNILFEDTRFVYPQRPHHPVMRGLQFTAKKGQTVALVGPSGSGKSTVISMLERFYDATGGAVRFDGMDLRDMSLHNVRSQMALVGQEPRLFAGTIKDNICFGLEGVSDVQIREALDLANATNFVNSMPQGLETEVGEKGTQLSGGQKQRIAIARALVRDPVILLLDEATSALDSESERAVQEALDRASEGRTCITIAHRLSSIQNADIIIYVENGIVRESGTHTQLMNIRGRYYQLIKKQDLTS